MKYFKIAKQNVTRENVLTKDGEKVVRRFLKMVEEERAERIKKGDTVVLADTFGFEEIIARMDFEKDACVLPYWVTDSKKEYIALLKGYDY